MFTTVQFLHPTNHILVILFYFILFYFLTDDFVCLVTNNRTWDLPIPPSTSPNPNPRNHKLVIFAFIWQHSGSNYIYLSLVTMPKAILKIFMFCYKFSHNNFDIDISISKTSMVISTWQPIMIFTSLASPIHMFFCQKEKKYIYFLVIFLNWSNKKILCRYINLKNYPNIWKTAFFYM